MRQVKIYLYRVILTPTSQVLANIHSIIAYKYNVAYLVQTT